MLIEDIQRDKTGNEIPSIVKVLVMLAKGKNAMGALRELSNDNVLYHDPFRGQGPSNFMGMMSLKPRKRPSNTPLPVHNEYDMKMEKMYGHKFRSDSLFTYPSRFTNVPVSSDNVMLILPSDSAKLLYSTSPLSPHDFFIRFSKKNTELLSKLSDVLRAANVDKYLVGEIVAMMDINDMNGLRKTKTHTFSDVYAYALKQYPDQSNLILKYYIKGLERFLDNDVKKHQLTDINRLHDEYTTRPEVMIADEEVIYIRLDELIYNIDDNRSEFIEALRKALDE